jgi:peptide/nickel transport system permease protein
MGMLTYILRRVLLAIPMIILLSIICFLIIQLPPGDYITSYAALVANRGGVASQQLLDVLRSRYGLEQPVYVMYWKWIIGFPKGDFGIAMSLSDTPVSELLRERIPLTLILNFLAFIFAVGIAIPIGVYSATHKYTFMDYFLTFLAFIGISIPGFLLALIIIFVSVFYLDSTYIGSLFSPEYISAPWSWARVLDFIKHLPAPIVAIGVAGTSNTMRIVRGNMLDILNQQYIQTARAKGLKEGRVLTRHALRIAINPIISRVGVYLPEILATEMLVSIVLNLRTIGPTFYQALIAQDMYLAGTILLVISVLLIVGNLLADIALAWSDPRIRYD